MSDCEKRWDMLTKPGCCGTPKLYESVIFYACGSAPEILRICPAAAVWLRIGDILYDYVIEAIFEDLYITMDPAVPGG